MMLNDSMYGILFRDINPIRTFVDQRFSRQVHARAGIIINTGEDNYLTTADAVDAAHTVTVSQLLNEYFAHEAGLADWQLGLGHAFEINPDLPESFRLELAHALLARELFPDAPLKWMPPTKHMTGDVFRGNLLDGFFNLAGALTGQGILLVGMMTEAVVTPWLSDRDIALQNVRYVLGAAGDLHEDFVPAPGGFIQRPGAHGARRGGRRCWSGSATQGLLTAIAEGTFGIMKRPADRRQGPGRGRAHRGRLLQPGHRDPGGAVTEARATGRTSRRARIVRPYGDTTGDGMVQLSFTLPVPHDKRAEGAALQLAAKMGMDPAMVVHAKPIGDGFTFFVVYGRVNHLVDLAKVQVVRAGLPAAVARRRSTRLIQARLRRKLVVVGACIGTDAHTVGIDAILNVKGIAGEKGLEYYRELRVVNLGAQVSVPELVERGPGGAGRRGAGRRRWSRSATRTCTTPGRCRRRSGRRSRPARRPLLVVGGPRFDEMMAAELGVDRIFGRGTTPREVAVLPGARVGARGDGEGERHERRRGSG